MELTLTPDLKEWLAKKGKNTLTIDLLISRGGCCGGCAYKETVINYGQPKDDPGKYLLFEEDGLKAYVPSFLGKKTKELTLYLKGSLLKRPALKGYEPDDCSWQ